MPPATWSRMHGAAVHFPIALVLCSLALESLACLPASPERRRGLRSAGYWTLLLGAASTVPAVVSGLVMTKGVMLGHDALRLHHLFAWPAFAVIIGTATWRVLADDLAGRKTALAYLAAVGLGAMLVLAAGYWGG